MPLYSTLIKIKLNYEGDRTLVVKVKTNGVIYCLQIPFDLVTRLWDTYLAEGDALPDFLVYIYASFLLTVRKLCLLSYFCYKLDYPFLF